MRRQERRLSAWAVVVAVCLAMATTAGAGSATRTPWHLSTLPAGTSFAEPGVAAGRDGTLLANACTANTGGQATFWRSTDGGRNWSRGFPIGTSPIGCGDADTAIGSDGYEYALVLGSGVSVYRSRDGKRWSGPAAFPPPHGEDQPDRPWLVTVPGHSDIVHVFNSEVGGNIVEWTSTDHAASFTGPVPVTGGLNSQAVLALGSRPLVNPAHPDQMRLLYETASWTGAASSVSGSGVDQFPLTQLWQASSDDGGRSWTNQLVLDLATTFHQSTGTIGHLLPATAVDQQGTTYVVLSVQLGGSTATHLYLLHSTRTGGWSAPVRVDHAGASNVYPAIAVSRPGHLYISWYGSDSSSFNDPKARWQEHVTTTRNALTNRPTFTAAALGPPVHTGAIEPAGAVGNDLGENWSLRDFQSIVIDSCAQPHILWASDYATAGHVATATTGPACRRTPADREIRRRDG